MTGVTFKGRLGNQLFQYVFLLYLKANNKGKIIFSPNPHHASITKYFDLGTCNNVTFGSKIVSLITRSIPKIVTFQHVFVQNFIGPKDYKAKNKVMYNGYFQSDWYYKKLPTQPKINIKKKYVQVFKNKFGQLFEENKTIVVHIRRTDYLNYGKRDISVPLSFFKTQLSKIKELDTYKVIFVSDDMQYIKQVFEPKENYIFSQNDEIIDFQLIHNADIAIISNSTFAWWACYLSTKQQTVIAPQNWFGIRIGREHPKGIMTEKFNWVKIDE
jgi:hypothetical protein